MTAEHTDDGRYVVVHGRRWRASDPGLPEQLRQELVDELMAARRAVRDDPDAARPRVQDAKVALGERGEPWWEPTDGGRVERMAAAARALRRHRGAGAAVAADELATIVGNPANAADLVRRAMRDAD